MNIAFFLRNKKPNYNRVTGFFVFVLGLIIAVEWGLRLKTNNPNPLITSKKGSFLANNLGIIILALIAFAVLFFILIFIFGGDFIGKGINGLLSRLGWQ